jgi:hypothetical protein
MRTALTTHTVRLTTEQTDAWKASGLTLSDLIERGLQAAGDWYTDTGHSAAQLDAWHRAALHQCTQLRTDTLTTAEACAAIHRAPTGTKIVMRALVAERYARELPREPGQMLRWQVYAKRKRPTRPAKTAPTTSKATLALVQ